MILYHGSRTGGIEVLEPRLANHDRPYIYLSTLEVVAAFYLCNAVERPYYWFPYGFSKNNPEIPVYDELYPNALEEVSSGIKGYIYKVDVSDEQIIPFKNIPCARLGIQPLPVHDVIYVPNAYELLQSYVEQGKLIVGRFEDKSEKELNWYYKAIEDYIREKNMHSTPDCSYAMFIKDKFPFIWDSYINNL